MTYKNIFIFFDIKQPESTNKYEKIFNFFDLKESQFSSFKAKKSFCEKF